MVYYTMDCDTFFSFVEFILILTLHHHGIGSSIERPWNFLVCHQIHVDLGELVFVILSMASFFSIQTACLNYVIIYNIDL